METVIVTGATSGIGLETVRLLASRGYRVLGIGHRPDAILRAENDIQSSVPQASVRYFCADLLQQREILHLAGELTSDVETNSHGRLHALINNAGCARSRYMTTEDGIEHQFALNYLSGCLLTHELLPLLLKARGRVIMSCSQSHKGAKVHWNDLMLRRRYNPLTAYKQSKLCDILFAKALNDRYRSFGLTAYAVDPGLVNTDIGSKAGGIVKAVWRLRRRHGVHPRVPAKTYVFLCQEIPRPCGLYYHACRAQVPSREVTGEQAERLLQLSERLCGISFEVPA